MTRSTVGASADAKGREGHKMGETFGAPGDDEGQPLDDRLDAIEAASREIVGIFDTAGVELPPEVMAFR